MKRFEVIALLLAAFCLGQQVSAAEPAKLTFETYSGYFVSNKFESKSPGSFVVIHDQKQFDNVFGAAFVMQDKSHRLPKDAFKSLMVIARIKRGNAMVEYKVESVTEVNGVVELRYTTNSTKSDTATFACPLIVSVPKGTYTAIQFVENGKPVKKVELTNPFVLSLDKAKVGELPEGWSEAKTGEGPGSVWKVLEDKGGKKVLAQTSDQGPNRLFNLCVAENTSFADIDLSVAFKAVAGKLDQGGGPVWRYTDADNYYIARMNPLEDNYRVYKVVAGKRTQLGSVDIKISSGEWHTIRVVHKADHIQCYLDGKLHLDVKDDTFKDAGKIGLWTKADAQTFFANLKAKSAVVPASGKQSKADSRFEELLSQGVVVSKGVVYKKAGPEVNRKALEKLSQAFLPADRKAASADLFGEILICGPGLWRNIKDDAAMKKIETGVTKINVPTNNGVQVLDGKLFQHKEEVEAFWKAFLRKYKLDPQATIRRPIAKELDLYWAMISYDITEPIFMIESKDAAILVQFTDKDVKIGWIDDYKEVHFTGER